MKALVINTARMGDLIQSTPMMQGLQSLGYEVTLLHTDGFKEICTMLAGVDHDVGIKLADIVSHLTVVNGRFNESYLLLASTLLPLREQNFDLVINATHSAYSALMTSIIAGKKSIGLSCEPNGAHMNTSEWGRYYLTSQLCRASNRFNLVDVHRMMAGVDGHFPVKLNIPEAAHMATEQLIAPDILKSKGLIGIVPGASTPEKTLPAETFAEAISELLLEHDLIPVILGTSKEAAAATRISELVPGIINLCGKTDVATLAALIARCELLLTNDTGPMHIAVAVGTKVIDISLGSALANETAPYGEGHYVVEGRIGCYPCLPRMHCTHYSCSRIIPAGVIAGLADSILSGSELRPELLGGVENVNIYRTDFDDDGFLQVVPVVKRVLTDDQILHEFMKQVWIDGLGNGLSRNKSLRERFARTRQHLDEYFLRSPAGDYSDKFLEGLDLLAGIALIGYQSCDELVKLADYPSEIETLKKLSAAIHEIDRGIAQLAYARPEIMPFAAQFTSAKDNVHSECLAEHSRKTAALFRQLEGWCATLSNAVRDYITADRVVDAA